MQVTLRIRSAPALASLQTTTFSTSDKPFIVQSGATVNKNNAQNIPDDWSCGATAKGSMTVELFMSLCVHHVENNLKPKGYGAGGIASILIFDGHASRWSYAGLMYLMANNCWPFCLASHTSTWAQVIEVVVGSRVRGVVS